jgi:hypothetical protein
LVLIGCNRHWIYPVILHIDFFDKHLLIIMINMRAFIFKPP